jgi:hypothetical protein
VNPLEFRAERLRQQLRPEPPGLLTVILAQFSPVPEDAVLPAGFYRVGRFGIATFLGGTPKEQQRELKTTPGERNV